MKFEAIEKINNYEKDASKRAMGKNSFLQNILGKGAQKEDVIILDAEQEDEYRRLAKDGAISEEELLTFAN